MSDHQNRIDNVKQGLNFVKLTTAFRDIALARMEHDEDLTALFHEAAGKDMLSSLSSRAAALELQALFLSLGCSDDGIDKADLETLTDLEALVKDSAQLSDSFAGLMVQVMSDQDVEALMPKAMHTKDTREWLQDVQAPVLAKLCRVYPRLVS